MFMFFLQKNDILPVQASTAVCVQIAFVLPQPCNATDSPLYHCQLFALRYPFSEST